MMLGAVAASQPTETDNMAQPAPPFVRGLPVIGNLHQFMQDPVSLVRRGYEQHGRLFAIRLANKPVAVLLGPEFNRFFFEQTDKLLSIREGYPFLKRMFDERLYFMGPLDEYKAQRAILLPAFQGPRMNAYVAAMAREATDFLDTLGDEGEFDAVETLGPLVMNVAARAFLGDEFRGRFGGQFYDLFRDFSGAIDLVLPGWLPLPKFIRSKRARKRMHEMVGALISERRRVPSRPDDFLQGLIDARYPDGKPVSVNIIIDLILLLVWAGHETTAGHISWGLIQLLRNADYLDTVLAEQDALIGDNPVLSLDKMRQLKRIEWALKESERTQPVASALVRAVAQPFDLGGYHIPAGWLVATSPAVTHGLADVFRDPERWDPERFSPGRAEDRQGYSLIGFGGGPHRCLGLSFAYLEMKVILTLMLQRYELELLDLDPQPVSGTKTKWPKSPARIYYRRRKLLSPASTEPQLVDSAQTATAASVETTRGCPFHRPAK